MLLQRGGRGDDLHGGLIQDGSILRDCGKVGKQRLKTVDGKVVFRAFGLGLVESFGRTHRGSNDGIALRLAGGGIVIVKENRRQSTAHVPFDIVGQHAEQDVSANPVGQIVVDGADLEIDRF